MLIRRTTFFTSRDWKDDPCITIVVALHLSKYGILSGKMQCAAAKLHCMPRNAVRAATTDVTCFNKWPKTAQVTQLNLNIMNVDKMNYEIYRSPPTCFSPISSCGKYMLATNIGYNEGVPALGDILL